MRYPCHDDASRRSAALPAGLRQQRAGLHPSLPRASTPVGEQRSAPLIFRLKRSDHITDALDSLHWLRAPERIQYKVAVLGYQVLHGSAPRYPGPPARVADLPGPRTLRSAATNRLVLPSVKRTYLHIRAGLHLVAQRVIV